MLVCRANDSDNPNWTVEDSTDLNYGLRVLEGWMKQAHVYIEATTMLMLILSPLLLSSVVPTTQIGISLTIRNRQLA